jgi:hypothetical protein
MTMTRTTLGRTLLGFALLAVCGIARAQAQTAAADDDIDDPKMARRLGTRIWWGTPPPPAPAPAALPAATVAGTARAAAAPSAGEVDNGVPTLARSAEPPPAAGAREWTPPRLKLGYRHFDFVQIGASSSISGAVASEPFNSIGVDVYPLSQLVRVGLSTQYGWQSGTFVASGDYFATQSVSLGVQYLEAGRFVPFAEGFGGIGYMRRLQFDRTVPTVYGQLGVDVGTEIYFARAGYISLAIGYLRPINGFARVQEFETVFVDTWSFKLGIGI